MAKSKLSTEEIRKLRESGATLAEVAEKAGIQQGSVKTRLFPLLTRAGLRERYRRMGRADKKRFRDQVIARQNEEQRVSEKKARPYRLGGRRWTRKEVAYLRKWGKVKTRFQLALALRRTLRSVARAVKTYKVALRA